ncbi:MAG: hypothetical protein ACRBC3_09025 [Burkholderiaceae bacterium]
MSKQDLQQVVLTRSAIPADDFDALLAWFPLTQFERLQSEQFKFYQQTFWYPLKREPLNRFERVIQQLKPLASPPAGVTGVEWWFSVSRINSTPLWLLPLHFDRADLFEKKFSRIRHPDLASVLFLNEVPYGDLVVTDQTLTEDGPWPYQPGAMEFMRPQANAYAVFPGGLLHGVIGRMQQPMQADQLRITMAVNWWIKPPKAQYMNPSETAPQVYGLETD